VLKRVLSIFFTNVVVDDKVGNFEFDLLLELKNDMSLEKIEKIKTLVNKHKNVRSHLRNIVLSYPSVEASLGVNASSVFGVDIHADTKVEHEIKAQKTVRSGMNYRVVFDTKSQMEHLQTDMKNRGGLIWRL